MNNFAHKTSSKIHNFKKFLLYMYIHTYVCMHTVYTYYFCIKNFFEDGSKVNIVVYLPLITYMCVRCEECILEFEQYTMKRRA